jgi:hypothetical protein
MDFTTSQMILCLKLISFAFNCYDGKKMQEKKEDGKEASVPVHHQSLALQTVPSLPEFFGYVYFFCGFSSGKK